MQHDSFVPLRPRSVSALQYLPLGYRQNPDANMLMSGLKREVIFTTREYVITKQQSVCTTRE